PKPHLARLVRDGRRQACAAPRRRARRNRSTGAPPRPQPGCTVRRSAHPPIRSLSHLALAPLGAVSHQRRGGGGAPVTRRGSRFLSLLAAAIFLGVLALLWRFRPAWPQLP